MPSEYTSPNAPTKAEILGTILCSVLSGHRRHAHISGIRGASVLDAVGDRLFAE